MLHHRVGGAHNVGLLEGVGADGVHAHLTGDDDQRYGIHVRIRDWGDHIGCARAGGDDAHAHLAGGQRIAFGCMAGGLFVAHQHEVELRVVLDFVIHRQNGAARNAEDVFDAQILQRTHQRLGAGHLLSIGNGLRFVVLVLGHGAECLQRGR